MSKRIVKKTQIVPIETDGQISAYQFNILVRGKPVLSGTLSREDLEKIHKLYSSQGADFTIAELVREFPTFSELDMQRVLRAFNITKSSSVLAPHQIAEMTAETATNYILRVKENIILKRVAVERNRYNEQKVKQLLVENVRLKESLQDIKSLLSEIDTSNIQIPQPVINPEKQKQNLIFYLSDIHTGAFVNNEGVYDNVYSEKIISERLSYLLNCAYYYAPELKSITVFDLGDAIDGFNRTTTRSSHNQYLPQNMSNREMIQTYIKVMVAFFIELSKINIPIRFIGVGESNHGGDGEYVAKVALTPLLEKLNVQTYIANRSIEHVNIDDTTFIFLHGKDTANQIKPFPLTLNDATENYFNEYIIRNNLSGNIVVVKGDLHQSATTYGKFFVYKSVASLFGASNWIHANFGKTEWGCDYSLLNGNIRQDGLIRE
jgi:hypothetical protein